MSAMRHLLDLCKRRGFLFQSAEIHGGLRGAYDYGPLGVELKRNVSQEWWNAMVYQRCDVVGIDTAIITPPAVLKTSGHVDQFTDEMVDSKLSKDRFRPDKAPTLHFDKEKMHIPITAPDKKTAKLWEHEIRTNLAPGSSISREGKSIFLKMDKFNGSEIILEQESGSPVTIPYKGYVDPASNSPFLTEARPFNLMFKTYLDPIDPIDKVITTTLDGTKTTPPMDLSQTRQSVDKTLYPSLTYLRPETAQGVFINYATVQRSHPHLKVPFGIAQIGKSFRNEIRLEHAIFRTPEFEQMELEYFVAPWQADQEFTRWRKSRMDWWKRFSRNFETRFRERAHAQDELAHYSSGCVDVEYLFPWGWGEVEGIANRGDFDLRMHSEATGIKLQYTDTILMQERQQREKATGVKKTEGLDRERFIPHVVESSCGLNRAMLALMLDAMEVVDEQGKIVDLEQQMASIIGSTDNNKNWRTVMKLHPRLAPIKVAILPLVSNNPDLVDLCQSLSSELRAELQIPVSVEMQSTTIGKRYYRMDEVGTPWCVTVDYESLQDGQVTIRDRDTGVQTRVHYSKILEIVRDGLRLYPRS
ncbi:hypothetical protein BG006_000522 [Podila minutissima]|uniref:Aminoacyl-transfer RNA synthetases class-II family profile domain-containing protein n=1 Tax=Podila minutissima TaxID=64525 RepID=A0A9P5SDF7_9FUNG|nr:hypothetical protein BG006_000522 [Podila minutissima]